MAWQQLDPRADGEHGRTAIVQLGWAWIIYVTTAGVYPVPAILLGGHCPNATVPCSIADEYGFSPAELGWLPSSFLLFKGLFAMPAGWALRRWGAKRCIVAGTALTSASTALYSLADGYAQLLMLYMSFGAAFCLSGVTALIVLINSWFPPHRKSTSIGVLVTGFSVAGVIWPAMVAAVAETHGWRLAAILLPSVTAVRFLPRLASLFRSHRKPSPSQPHPHPGHARPFSSVGTVCRPRCAEHGGGGASAYRRQEALYTAPRGQEAYTTRGRVAVRAY